MTQSLINIRDPKLYSLPKHQRPRERSHDIDREIGLKISKIEQKLLKKYRAYDRPVDSNDRKQHYQGTQTWVGLHPQVLQTPYSEIKEFLTHLVPHGPKCLVDLGAGYGRLGLVMSAFLPTSQFIGYEVMEERLHEARRIFELYDLENCEMRNENILDDKFILPKACVYFIYDFSDPLDLRVLLRQLNDKLSKDRFFLVARGEGVRSLIQNKFPAFHRPYGAYHSKNWSIYSSFCHPNHEVLQ